MKKTMLGLLILLLSLVLMPMQTEAAEEQITLTYERALQLALRDLLPVIDADAQIRDIQNRRDDLLEELRLLEQRRYSQERINELHNELWRLESQLWSAINTLEQMQLNTDHAFNTFFNDFQDFILSLVTANDNGEPPSQNENYVFSQRLQAAIQSMILAHEMNNAITSMEIRRNSIFDEIRNLQDETTRRERMADTRNDIAELNRLIEHLRLQQSQIVLAREAALRNAIVAVTDLSASIETARLSFVLTEENVIRVAVRYEIGLASSNDVRRANQSVIQAQMDYDAMLTNLRLARLNLNHMLGLPLAQLTVVDFEMELPEFPANFSDGFSRIISQSPPIRQLQLDVDAALAERRAYTGNDRNKIASLNETYERAVMGRNQAIAAMEAAMWRGYIEFEALQRQMNVLLHEHENSVQHLENALINYELGRSTQYDIAGARMSVYMIEQRINANFNSKWILSFLLENPSLL